MLKKLLIAAIFAAAIPAAVLAVEEQEPNWKVFDEEEDPTPQPIVKAMLKLANVGPTDVVYDLGCGDGRIIITAAKTYGASGLGIDFNPKMIERSKINAEKNGVADKTRFIEGDIFKVDMNLQAATKVTLFLWPSVNVRLRPRLLDELRPGTPVVSHQHRMGDWHPDRTVYVDTHTRKWGMSVIYLWIIPAKIAGSWKLETDGHDIQLMVDQKFQTFSGSVNGRRNGIRNGRINGTEVTFQIAASGKLTKYSGHVQPDGTITGESWRAMRK